MRRCRVRLAPPVYRNRNRWWRKAADIGAFPIISSSPSGAEKIIKADLINEQKPAFGISCSFGDLVGPNRMGGRGRGTRRCMELFYRHWIDDNISKKGITRDLEAMAKAGIDETFTGNVTDTRPNFVSPGEQDRKMVNRGQVCDARRECAEHAVREAERSGAKIRMFNCPGWSPSDGPWVNPEQAMRCLASTELRVSGSCKLRKRRGAPAGYFQQAAVHALPAPESDSNRAMGRQCSGRAPIAVPKLPAAQKIATYGDCRLC